ncbi:MAG: four helix bundle protein [Deltaproteobacteria bacterium CG2_30_63_29]|nr:MAG: four helix bundle protein [Deltaproteobacteria bacterium CG2_30_63_29]PJB48388.1 MAG: four helix bundle protein [Deltaproteobacteria bacterium CG_4_9_14_3_um_filter_63_12]
MRDHRKLRAFVLADALVLSIYKCTAQFPKSEMFGLTSQLRRAAVSVASNIVEGSARPGIEDYVRFLGFAYASLREVEYQLSISQRLGFLPAQDYEPMGKLAAETCKVLHGLILSLDHTPNGVARFKRMSAH